MSRLQCVSKGVGEHVFVSAMSMRLHVCCMEHVREGEGKCILP